MGDGGDCDDVRMRSDQTRIKLCRANIVQCHLESDHDVDEIIEKGWP